MLHRNNYMETYFEPGDPHEQFVLEDHGIRQDDRSVAYRRQDERELPTPPDSPLRRGGRPGRRYEYHQIPSHEERSMMNSRNFAPMGGPRLKKPLLEKWTGDLERLAKNIAKIEYVEYIPYPVLNGIDKTLVKTEDLYSGRTRMMKFIDKFRYIINSSSLLEVYRPCGPLLGAPLPLHAPDRQDGGGMMTYPPWTVEGVAVCIALALGVTLFVQFFYVGGVFSLSPLRIVTAAAILYVAYFSWATYMRWQWQEYICERTIVEMEFFIKNAEEFDSAAGAAMSYIMEVELVARGYRLSLPAPPLGRIEAAQETSVLKNQRIRIDLVKYLRSVIPAYSDTAEAIRQFAHADTVGGMDQVKNSVDSNAELLKEVVECMQLPVEEAQKILHLRQIYELVQQARRSFLTGVMSINPKLNSSDLLTFTAMLEGIRKCNAVTQAACYQVKSMLLTDQMYAATSPKSPSSPSNRHWRQQVQKVKALTNGVRSLQAKMGIMVEDANLTLNNGNEDISLLGPKFMDQYESIGKELKDLMEAWETGKASLQMSVDKDRNSRRMSRMSDILLSPRTLESLSTLSKQSGGPEEALDKLNGTSPHDSSPTSPQSPQFPQEPEMFEAIATQFRPRSQLTREERIQKMREERAAKTETQQKTLQNGWVIGELKNVLESRRAERDKRVQSMPISISQRRVSQS